MGTALPLSASTDVSFGLSASNQGVDGFYLNVGQYYGVPTERVTYVRERRIPDDEIPVVFFLAREARVSPEIIIEQRLGGRTWMDISLGFHLSPAIFYVPYQGDPGPPYGRAYGYYRHHNRAQWGTIRLADDDVVNMVNLRFMHDHYGYSPREVMSMRAKGGSFHEFGRGPRGGGKGKSHGPGPGPGGPKMHGSDEPRHEQHMDAPGKGHENGDDKDDGHKKGKGGKGKGGKH
ncbi:MAG: hypothetical protein V4498_00080 [candidate division FCPU426 bacterium]